MKRLFTFFTTIILAHSLTAQDVTSLDTVLVTASNLSLRTHETGRNITVIDGKDIALLPTNSLDELFQAIPGIEVQSRNGFGAQADILMRGGTFTQTLILLDGMRLNDPLTAHFNGNIPVTAAEIQRIEVMRGPAAAVYGPDAVGGVINIITKTFANRQKGKIDASGQIFLGENQLIQANQGISLVGDQFVLGGGLAVTQSAGQEIPAQMIDSSTTLDAYRNYFDIKTAGASLGTNITDNLSFLVHTAFDYRDFSSRYFYTTSPFD